MSEKDLLLVHLSDVHFHKRSGGPFDLDEDLRLSLETDASEFVKELSRRVDGILITGDIVYSGQKNEYEKAKEWLSSLCKKLNCHEENVWTVPGNHDVDRSIIDSSHLIKVLQKDLRSKDLNQINDGIENCFYNDKEAAKSLHSPLNNYMGFNKLYGGSITKDGSVYWEYDLPLNDTSFLRIRGLNSTLVSNALDNDGENKLILGEKQVQLANDNRGVVYLTMCHHPTDWLKDKDTVESYLNNRARLQLFGHKHNQSIQKINNSLRIVAGATHPDRDDSGWLPRYNFLAISVVTYNDTRKLMVKVYPRQWSKDYTRFMADFDRDGSEMREFTLDLPAWKPTTDQTENKKSPPEKENQLNYDEKTSESTNLSGKIENPHRKIVYRFYKLAFNMRYRIALDLNLIRDEDEGLEETDLFNKILLRAKDEKVLEALWEKTEKAHGNTDFSNNPFKGA